MSKGRRFSFFWISIFTIAGSGCAGCGDCFGPSSNTGCNFADVCEAGDCDLFGDYDSGGQSTTYDAGPPTESSFEAAENIVNPAGIVADGTNVFYIDGDSLFSVSRTFPPTVPALIAAGVTPVGGIAADDTYLYWASAGLASDAGAEDAGTDASDAGAFPNRGIFRVAKAGGVVEFLGDLDPLPGIAIANGNLFLNGRGEDGGVVGQLTIDGDAGFQPLSTFSGVAPSARSIAPFAPGVAFIDEPDIDFVDLTDGGIRTLVSGANAKAIVGTSLVPFYVSSAGASSLFESITNDAGGTIPFQTGDIASSGPYVYIADISGNRVLRYDTRSLGSPPGLVTMSVSPPVILAADPAGVCWIEGAPSQALFCLE